MSPKARNAIRRIYAAEDRGCTNGCQRHVRMMAVNLIRNGRDHMIQDEPEECAMSMLALAAAYLRREQMVRRWAERYPGIAAELDREKSAAIRQMSAALRGTCP